MMNDQFAKVYDKIDINYGDRMQHKVSRRQIFGKFGKCLKNGAECDDLMGDIVQAA